MIRHGGEEREEEEILSHQVNWDGSMKILVEPIVCKDFLKRKFELNPLLPE